MKPHGLSPKCALQISGLHAWTRFEAEEGEGIRHVTEKGGLAKGSGEEGMGNRGFAQGLIERNSSAGFGLTDASPGPPVTRQRGSWDERFCGHCICESGVNPVSAGDARILWAVGFVGEFGAVFYLGERGALELSESGVVGFDGENFGRSGARHGIRMAMMSGNPEHCQLAA